MKEIKTVDRSYIFNLKFYFSFDEEDFEGGWKPGQVKQRTKKSLNRDPNGNFVLEIWEHHDKFKAMDFTTKYYELDNSEVFDCLNKAFEQKKITEKQKNNFLSEYNAPFKKSVRHIDDIVVFDDGLYKLLKSSGNYFLSVNNKSYKLTCHPYEPDTCIEGRCIHNAFNITDIFECFRDNLKVTSITGREYSAKDFCDLFYAMVENNLTNESIEYVENFLWGKKKNIDTKYAPQKHSFGGAAERSEAEGVASQRLAVTEVAAHEVSGDDSDDEIIDQVELLKKATFDTMLPYTGYNFSKIYLKIKEKALCNITAVGLFGIKQPSTLYVGENGKLYATKGDINDIRVYDSVVDQLEYELKDHIPMGITD